MIDENVPYAELWFGTHKNGPGYIKNKDSEGEEGEEILLSEYFKSHSEGISSFTILQ